MGGDLIAAGSPVNAGDGSSVSSSSGPLGTPCNSVETLVAGAARAARAAVPQADVLPADLPGEPQSSSADRSEASGDTRPVDVGLADAAPVDAAAVDAAPVEAAAAGADEAAAGTRRRRKPASGRQREANQRNARKSTGPRSAAGKARSARNAVQHGVFAQANLLPGEDVEELDELEQRLYDEHQPAGPLEEFLLGRLVALAWKLRRLAQAEQELAWMRIDDRFSTYKHRLTGAALFGQDPAEIPEPNELSNAGEIFCDDFTHPFKSGRLQEMTQLEIRLTGQLLAVSRQLMQLRKLREGTKDEGRRLKAEERAAAATAARNEPIRDDDRGASSSVSTAPERGGRRADVATACERVGDEALRKDEGGRMKDKNHSSHPSAVILHPFRQEPPPQPARGQSPHPLASPGVPGERADGVPKEGEEAPAINAAARNEPIRPVASSHKSSLKRLHPGSSRPKERSPAPSRELHEGREMPGVPVL